jgi:hypothetical protein
VDLKWMIRSFLNKNGYVFSDFNLRALECELTLACGCGATSMNIVASLREAFSILSLLWGIFLYDGTLKPGAGTLEAGRLGSP